MPTYVEPVFRPPSEARSLIFQITIGCSQNHCAFCGMYKTKRFSLKPEAEVLAEIHGIPARYRPVVDRVFLADGDALVYPFDGLATILDRLASVFPNLTRVGSYASPRSLATKSVGELRHLRGKSSVSSTSGWSRGTMRPWTRPTRGLRPRKWHGKP